MMMAAKYSIMQGIPFYLTNPVQTAMNLFSVDGHYKQWNIKHPLTHVYLLSIPKGKIPGSEITGSTGTYI